jgi:hypothetical protein
MEGWAYLDNGKTVGVEDRKTMRSLIRLGVVVDQQLVCREGSDIWVPAGAVPELWEDEPQPPAARASLSVQERKPIDGAFRSQLRRRGVGTLFFGAAAIFWGFTSGEAALVNVVPVLIGAALCFEGLWLTVAPA